MKTGTKIMIGVGALAIAGVVFYFVAKSKGWIGGEKKSSACGCGK